MTSDLPPRIRKFNVDADTASAAVSSYNSAVDSYNSGDTSSAPDDGTMLSAVDAAIRDLKSLESALQGGISQAKDSSVETDLHDMLTAVQQMRNQYRSYRKDPTRSRVDTPKGISAMNSASQSLDSDCAA
ncbi:hypothetical protein ACWGNN_48380 [Streptomyces sp. NPDC055817]